MGDPQSFDDFADAYDRCRTLIDVPTWPMLAELGVPEGGRALDVGCGSGHRAVELAQHVDDVVGIDLSQPLIDIARARRPRSNVDFRCADLQTYRDDAGFDLIYSANTLHHVVDLPAALDHLRTMIRPAGWVVLTDNVQRTPAWLRWIWRHGGYHLAAIQDSHRGRREGLRGRWRYYRFQTSRRWVEHMKSDRFLDPGDFETTYLAAFPGGAVEHHGLATLVWQAAKRDPVESDAARTGWHTQGPQPG